MSHGRNECRIYVGNLPPDIRTKDIQDLFHKFGKVTFVDLKNRRGPPFAFVEFEDARWDFGKKNQFYTKYVSFVCTTKEKNCKHFLIHSLFLIIQRDADDAVKARDGYDYDGYRLRVEFPRGGGPGSYRGNRQGTGNSERGGGGGGGGRDNRGNRGPPARRSQFRVVVSGLPATGSWQDLKDHMREAGDVCFADVYKDGTGVVEFLRHEDMKYAIKKLDDSRFRSHEVIINRINFF